MDAAQVDAEVAVAFGGQRQVASPQQGAQVIADRLGIDFARRGEKRKVRQRQRPRQMLVRAGVDFVVKFFTQRMRDG